jgi:hypothetical protein
MEKQVLYKYDRIELEQFAVFNENYTQDSEEIDFQTEAQFSFDKEQSILCSTIVAHLYNGDKPLIKAELKSYFNIEPDSMEALRANGQVVFPPILLVQFASLCYGSMRGVLFAKTANTPLNKYILPPFNFGNIIDKGFTIDELA